jgi:hypothetical protein
LIDFQVIEQTKLQNRGNEDLRNAAAAQNLPIDDYLALKTGSNEGPLDPQPKTIVLHESANIHFSTKNCEIDRIETVVDETSYRKAMVRQCIFFGILALHFVHFVHFLYYLHVYIFIVNICW